MRAGFAVPTNFRARINISAAFQQKIVAELGRNLGGTSDGDLEHRRHREFANQYHERQYSPIHQWRRLLPNRARRQRAEQRVAIRRASKYYECPGAH